MILFFHFICLLARYIVTNFSKSLSESKVLSDDEEEENSIKSNFPDYMQNNKYVKHPIYKDGTLKFFPPVYVQRYETVALILKDPVWMKKIKKVVDFGCAELGFFMYLKNVESVNEILEVDVDAELLERCSHKAAPLTSDYLMSKENKPLDVYVLAGSVADYDDYLMGCDAVVAIELIEHLSEEAFKNMPYNIFHKIRPKLAIFTTPNADFNSLFPNFKDVRHEDHKFEWSRKEFFNWTQEIIKLYPEYSARFYGIGAGPEGTENLGCCSQMAVFQRSDNAESFSSARDQFEDIHNYKLIKHYKYPAYIDTRSTEEKIIHEIQYRVAYLNTLPTYYNYDTNESEIPLSLLKEYVVELCSDDEELRDILEKNGMILRKRNMSWFLVHTDAESSSSDQRCLDEDWLNEEISQDFYENEDLILDEALSWDVEPHIENINLKSAKSLEELEVYAPNQKEIIANLQNKCIAKMKEEVRSAPHSCNHLVKQMSPAKKICSNRGSDNNNKIKNYDNDDDDDDDEDEDDDIVDVDGNDFKRKSLNQVKSKIPRKRNENKEDRIFPESHFGKSSLSYKPRSFLPGF